MGIARCSRFLTARICLSAPRVWILDMASPPNCLTGRLFEAGNCHPTPNKFPADGSFIPKLRKRPDRSVIPSPDQGGVEAVAAPRRKFSRVHDPEENIIKLRKG